MYAQLAYIVKWNFLFFLIVIPIFRPINMCRSCPAIVDVSQEASTNIGLVDNKYWHASYKLYRSTGSKLRSASTHEKIKDLSEVS